MQFHHHGYVSGDPRPQEPAGVGVDRPEELPEQMDVLIVGTGPAGMITAAQLSQFPDVNARIVDSRPSRLAVGQADGVACRSVETFQAFGFAEELIREAYTISETAFWGPGSENPQDIVRTARTPDDPRNVSEFPHLICNQVRVQDLFAKVMEDSPSKMGRDFGYEYVSSETVEGDEYPVKVTLRRTVGENDGETVQVETKYLVGADGARSQVRRNLGGVLKGDSANHAWGVMDVLAETDFPDIRTKCIITSHDGGSILHIPREGGYLFRTYVDLGEVGPDDAHEVRKTQPAEVIERARKIMHPYQLNVKHIAWFSVYEVGQRVTDNFCDVDPQDTQSQPRTFIMGDACHTHSAKAGQGMNVSMQDGFNLGWKLGQVLRGQAKPDLLRTYNAERQPIAQQLIDFDREWSSLMAAKPLDPEHPELGGVDPQEFRDYYQRSFDFTMGFGTQYQLEPLTIPERHQELATGFDLGRRFHSYPAKRIGDALEKELGHHATADGRWRIYVFADAPAPGEQSKTRELADWLSTDPASPVLKYTKDGRDIDDLFDVKVIYQQDYTQFDMGDVPDFFIPRHGPFQVADYEKVYATLPEKDIFEGRGVSRDGAVVIVRPDMYVSAIMPLDATDEIAEYFDALLVPQGGTEFGGYGLLERGEDTPKDEDLTPEYWPTILGAPTAG